jgi:hypothetical protein
MTGWTNKRDTIEGKGENKSMEDDITHGSNTS